MKYAGGTVTNFNDVMAKIQQLTKSNNDLRKQLNQVQNASQMQYNMLEKFAACQAQGQGFDSKTGKCTSIVPQCDAAAGETLVYETTTKRYVCSKALITQVNKLRLRLARAENTTSQYANLLYRFSACQAQGLAYNATVDSCDSLAPQCSREGETLEFQGGQTRYVCSSFLLETINRIKDDVNLLLNSQISLGDMRSIPGKTCRDIKKMRPRALSGVYWISPTSGNSSDAFQVYCDMLTDGGGWTLVTVIKTVGATYEKKYPIKGMNEDRLLADRNDEWASLSRVKFNAIFAARNDSIMRVYASAFAHLRTGDRSSSPRTYYIKKLKSNDSFDAFASVRHVPEWGDKTKAEYKLNYDRTGRVHPYNPDTHDFPDAGKTMNHWESHTVIVDGVKYTTSRHGIVGDAFSNCEWLYQFNVAGTQMNCIGNADVFAKIWIK